MSCHKACLNEHTRFAKLYTHYCDTGYAGEGVWAGGWLCGGQEGDVVEQTHFGFGLYISEKKNSLIASNKIVTQHVI